MMEIIDQQVKIAFAIVLVALSESPASSLYPIVRSHGKGSYASLVRLVHAVTENGLEGTNSDLNALMKLLCDVYAFTDNKTLAKCIRTISQLYK